MIYVKRFMWFELTELDNDAKLTIGTTAYICNVVWVLLGLVMIYSKPVSFKT